MEKDKNLYTEQEEWLLEGKEAGDEKDLGGDEEDPKLKDKKSFRSASEKHPRYFVNPVIMAVNISSHTAHQRSRPGNVSQPTKSLSCEAKSVTAFCPCKQMH